MLRSTALDEKRTALGISWQRVADQMWEQSAALNGRRRDHPISPSTLTNMTRSQRTSCQHALFMLRWLGRAPESFLRGAAEADERFNLPAAGQDHRLRWALKLLYAALDEKRRQEGSTWIALAAALSCSPASSPACVRPSTRPRWISRCGSPSGSAAQRPTSSTRRPG